MSELSRRERFERYKDSAVQGRYRVILDGISKALNGDRIGAMENLQNAAAAREQTPFYDFMVLGLQELIGGGMEEPVDPDTDIMSQEEYEAEFAKIKPASHWKDPIRARIKRTEFNRVARACMYFTATELKIEKVYDDGTIDVSSVGYWAGPAA